MSEKEKRESKGMDAVTPLPPAALAAAEIVDAIFAFITPEARELKAKAVAAIIAKHHPAPEGERQRLLDIVTGIPIVERGGSRDYQRGFLDGQRFTRDVCADRMRVALAPGGEREGDGGRPLPFDRDQLGRFVREAWVRWAQTQPNPKPSWLVSYDALDEPDKEADRQIGEAIARWTLIGDAARAALSPGGEREGDYVLVPKGWKLVPEEPTQEQIGVEITPLLVAGSLENSRVRQWRDALYRKMVANAPAPPLAPQEAGR